MAEFISIMISIITGVIGSCIFLYFFLTRLRPKIEISPFIALYKSEKGEAYVFKIVNKTSRPIINVRYKVAVVQPTSVPGGVVSKNENLALKRDEVFYLERYDKNDKNAEYAWRFSCFEDIDGKWLEMNGGYVVIHVIATDSLSGLSKVFIQKYHAKSESLREGSHKFGSNLEVQ